MVSRPSKDMKNFTLKNVSQDKLLFLNENKGNLRKTLEELPKMMQNPFTVMRRWLNYEILDLEAILEAISRKSEMDRRKCELVVKRQEELTALKNMQSGKDNLYTFFMSNSSKREKITMLQRTTGESALSIECLELIHKITLLQLN